MNEQSLRQANALLAAAAGSANENGTIAQPLADLGRDVGLPSPLALARAVRALVSRGRLASEDGRYRLLDARPLELGERVSVAPKPGRRGRGRRRAEAPAEEEGGVPSYSSIGKAVVDRLIELARETTALSELTELRRQLREERSNRVRAEERATELHTRARDLEAKLGMAEENLRRVIGVARQHTSPGATAAKPSDPEAQALLAILRGNGGAEGAEERAEQREASTPTEQ